MLTLMEAPQAFISLPEAKKHLNLSSSHTRHDDMIEAQINSAIGFLDGPEGYLGSAIAPQKWKWQTGAFIDPMRVPLGPILSIDQLSYINTDGDTVVLDPATFYLFGDARSPYLRPIGQWRSDVANRDDAITLQFTAGRAQIPPQLVSAAMLIVGQLYRFREIDVDVRNFPTSFSAMDLARPYRASI